MQDAFIVIYPEFTGVVIQLTDPAAGAYACEMWSWQNGDATARRRYYVAVFDRVERKFYHPTVDNEHEAIALAAMLNRKDNK